MTAQFGLGARGGSVVLHGVGPDLRAHEAVYGPLPLLDAAALVDRLRRSGLTGRGGGAFPAWRKLQTSAEQGHRPLVVANASEGEPWSGKDRALLDTAPHLVLDGLAVLGSSLHARDLVLVAAPERFETIRAAAAQRTDGGSHVRLVPAAGRYVGGEASAAAALVRGRRALPSDRRVPLATRGPGGAPTFLSNVETIAEIALVARFGGDWFRALGVDGTGGIRLVSITGDVRRPQVREVRSGVRLGDLIALARPDRPAAAILGGLGGSWVRADRWDVSYADAALAAIGARPGAGVIRVVGAGRCPLRLTSRILHRLAAESAGQCGPCVFGLPALAAAFDEVVRLGDASAAVARVDDLAGEVSGRGMCHHPDGAAALVRSTLGVWWDHLEQHRRGRCDLEWEKSA
ncbi:MAG: NADH-ubiquinone oxidoreductase-F iron-sulfur binding region domain-containing protein [Pseudoclavibacter sp.]